jgi:hypothetical protein
MTTTAADAQQITETYKMLAPAPGRSMHLLPIYEMFDWSLERFHAAIRHLNATGGAFIEPEPKLRSLTDTDHMVSLKIGGEWKHSIAIDY